MNSEYEALMGVYVTELRQKKTLAEDWWRRLNSEGEEKRGPYKPKELWPMGPANHPWIIAIYRKYFFLCEELNQKYEQLDQAAVSEEESKWGEDQEEDEGPIDPKVFVHELLYGGETQDLALFIERLVFVPIGVKDGMDV